MLRRRRLANLRRLIRHRHRCQTLPDDDAGREYLFELLLPISVGPYEAIRRPGAIELWGPADRMRREIQQWAPWMDRAESDELIDRINQMAIWERKPKARPLGMRLRVTYAEREELKLWTIAPCDVTERGMALLRKRKKRQRERIRRQSRGAKLQAASVSKAKPWVAAGISRRTYYYRLKQANCTTSCQVNLISTGHEPVQPHQPPVSKKESADKKATTNTQAETAPQAPQKPETPAMDMHEVVLARSCATIPRIGHNAGPPLDELAAPALDEIAGADKNAGGNNELDLQEDL